MSKRSFRKFVKYLHQLNRDLYSDNKTLSVQNDVLRRRIDRLEKQLQEKIANLPIVSDPYCPPGTIFLVTRAN
jgi:hypothetical protein